MAESVLSKLVKTDKETKERLVSIDNTLQKILLNDQKIAKIEEKRYKREQQSNKRKSGDKTLTGKILGEKSKNKKEKKGFLDGLLGGILGPLSSLIGGIGIPNILAALGITALGSTIAGYFTSKKFRDFLDKNVGVPLGRALERGARDLLKNTPLAFTPDQDKTNENIPLTGLNTKGTISLLEGIVKSLAEDKDATEEQKKVSERLLENITTIEKKRKVINELEKQRDKFQRDIDQAQDSITSIKEQAKDNDRELSGMEKAAIKSYELAIKEYKKDRDDRITNIRINEKQIKSLLSVEAHGETNNKLLLELINQTRERQSTILGEVHTPLTIDNFKQSGGPITVPGSSTGDKHPALLPPGSFVLNRNASGYQNGGIPAMLESGEKVYGPGQWGPREMMLNKAVPRFQEGGLVLPDWGAPTPKSSLVEASHRDTGTGWSVGKDAHNRPAVFSKSAAEALLQAIKDSNGAVKASDITSSTRTPAKNAAVKGAPNSNHLHGNAVDIHGTSKSWLKQNGMKYGWKHLVYSGHDGHFDFIKGGALPVQDRDDTSSQDSKVGGQSIMNNLMKLGGQVGQFFKEIMSVIGGALGDSGLMSFLFGGGSGSGPNIEGLSTYSEPLTGDSAAKAKDMFEYIVEKGYSKAQAKGIVANIQRESGFDIDAVGDGGSSHGLFQWHADRASRMKAAVPDYANNWKAQIDYALQEHVGPQYKSATAGMNAKDAAYWWMNKWEIPADRARGGPNHNKMNGFIDSYGFQKGGVVNMRGSGSGPDISQKSENQFIEKLSSAMSPVVVPVPMGVGGGGGTSGSHEVSRSIPSLSANPSNSVALDLAYRLSVGASFS